MANKYGNKKVTIGEHKFDSIAESKYFAQLKWLEANKQILFFRLQPRYLLQEAFDKGDKHYRKTEYVADFEIHHLDGSIEVVDIKGFSTDVFQIKKKLFEFKYPHKLSVLTYDDKWGFVETDKLRKGKINGQQNKAKKAVRKVARKAIKRN